MAQGPGAGSAVGGRLRRRLAGARGREAAHEVRQRWCIRSTPSVRPLVRHLRVSGCRDPGAHACARQGCQTFHRTSAHHQPRRRDPTPATRSRRNQSRLDPKRRRAGVAGAGNPSHSITARLSDSRGVSAAGVVRSSTQRATRRPRELDRLALSAFSRAGDSRGSMRRAASVMARPIPLCRARARVTAVSPGGVSRSPEASNTSRAS